MCGAVDLKLEIVRVLTGVKDNFDIDNLSFRLITVNDFVISFNEIAMVFTCASQNLLYGP